MTTVEAHAFPHGAAPRSRRTRCRDHHDQTVEYWTAFTDIGPERECVLIDPTDMRDAQRLRRSIRSQVHVQGSAEIAVIVDVTAVVADSVAEAFALSDPLPPGASGLRYVGTPGGLAGLVSDVCVTAVADGVRVIGRGPMLSEVENELRTRGLQSIRGRERCPCDGIVRGRRRYDRGR